MVPKKSVGSDSKKYAIVSRANQDSIVSEPERTLSGTSQTTRAVTSASKTPTSARPPTVRRRAAALSRWAKPRSTSSTKKPQTVRTISGPRKKTSREFSGIAAFGVIGASSFVWRVAGCYPAMLS